jgi:DnaJ-class molecular chaperone
MTEKDMPIVCSACSGAGKKFYAFHWLTCPMCDGNGKAK